jgi:hypothetical protein
MVGALDAKWKVEDEQAQLNELGQKGWELISIVTRPGPDGRPCVYYYLRRKLFHKKLNLAVDNPKIKG